MQQFILNPRRDISAGATRLTCKHFKEVEGSRVSVGFLSHPLTCKSLTIKPKVVATSCSLGLISTVPLSTVMDQYHLSWKGKAIKMPTP